MALLKHATNRSLRLQKRFPGRLQIVLPLSIGLALSPVALHRARGAQQSAAGNGPSGKAQLFTGQEIDRQFAELAKQANATGGGGAMLGNYGTHTIGLSLRTNSGNAEVHAHFDDVIFVRHGKATLWTGGTVVDSKTGADGETKGSSIREGTRQAIAAGDVIHIPAGTPHQILIQPGTSFNALVVKIKE